VTMLRNLWLPLSAAFRLDRRAALIAFLEVVGTILSNLLPLAFGLLLLGACTPPNVQPHGRIKLQCAATSRCFRTAKHHSNFLPNLVDKNEARV